MKLIKILKITIMIFLLLNISLEAQNAKKGKKKVAVKKTEKKAKEPASNTKKDKQVEAVEEEEVSSESETMEPPSPSVKEETKNDSKMKEDSKSKPVSRIKEEADSDVSPEPMREGQRATNSQMAKEEINPITFNQYFSNDIWFRGFSVLGHKLSQRDNMAFDSIPQAWNVVTGVAYSPSENFSIGMNVYSPTAHRANRDNDYFMQSAPGNTTDFSGQFFPAVITNNPNAFIDYATRKGVDPTSIQMRKEKNGLKDIFDASFTYKYNTRFGKIVAGAYIANNDNYNITLGELVAGIEFPFLKALSPAYTSYYRVSSEGGGGGNGTSNHRLSISHKFFENKTINVTTSLASGYQYHSNLTDYRSGVSDITPKVQINFGAFYFSVLDMIRPDSSLWDAPGGFGSSGVYKDTNRRDGRVEDPSKVHGVNNQLAVNQISKGVNDIHSANATADPNGYGREAVKEHLIQKYQTQKFVTHVFHFTVGYSLKF